MKSQKFANKVEPVLKNHSEYEYYFAIFPQLNFLVLRHRLAKEP